MNTKRFPRGLYAPECLESRIAPATFIVDSLLDNNADGTLRKEIADANARPGADTIVFKGLALEGEIPLALGQINITDSLTIKGPGAGKLIIDAGGTSRIFNIVDATKVAVVSISGLSMVAGNAGAGDGGGIFSEEALALTNVVITGCVASTGGGVLCDTPGKISIKASIVSGNAATVDYGGGLYLESDAGIQIIGSTITGNTAASTSGGLYAHIPTAGTGDILIDKCFIALNTAVGSAGGAGFDQDREVNSVVVGKVIIRNSVITGNSSGAEGGGLYFDNGHVLIERCQITNNVAAERGGGIGDDGTESLTIKSSSITNNRTTDSTEEGGGGIYIDSDSKVVIQSTILQGNTSASGGGAIFMSDSLVLLKSSTISGNTAAGGNGGGVAATAGSTLTVESSLFADNRCSLYGGGLSTTGTGAGAVPLTIKTSRFLANHAGSGGGGVDTQGDGTVLITGSRFISNTASEDGGAMYLRSTAAIVLSTSLITNNAADDDGGGVALGGTGAKTIRGTLIRDNIAASDDGGGVALFDGTLTFFTSSIMYNAAAGSGGGIVNDTATLTPVVLNGSKVLANTAATGAQISGPFTP